MKPNFKVCELVATQEDNMAPAERYICRIINNLQHGTDKSFSCSYNQNKNWCMLQSDTYRSEGRPKTLQLSFSVGGCQTCRMHNI